MTKHHPIEIEHKCGVRDCDDFFPTAGRLYTHLREHGLSIQTAYSHYVIAMTVEAMGRGDNAI